MWLYRLLEVIKQSIADLARHAWKEPAVRHATRICVVALSKSGATEFIALFVQHKATADVFTSLLNMTLYFFCLDITLQLLEEAGIPVRKLLRKLYRRLMPGPPYGRRRSLPPASKEQKEQKEETPPRIESTAEYKTTREEDDDDDQAAAA